MASSFDAIKSKVKGLFGSHSFDWLDRSYVFDWTVATALWIMSGFATYSLVYQRSFSVDDPLISHEKRKQQVSGALNNTIALYVPLALSSAVGVFRGSLMEVHHAIISLWAGRGLSRLITEILKNRIGRLRPDFLSRCKWDTTLAACTGKADEILDGRKSFPSGHSSTAFAGMTFLALFFSGKTAAWCFHAPLPPASFSSSRLFRFFLTLIPLFWASYVAISRVQDYRHHKEDVIVGSFIGVFSATTCYLIFWSNPFSTFARSGRPRMLYRQNEDARSRNDGFELTSLDDEIEAV